MSISVRWHDPARTIVLQSFSPGWTWEDFDRAHDETFALIASVPHTACFITDLTQAPTPPTPNVIGHLQRIARGLPDNAGHIVVVEPGPFMRLMGDIFLRAMGSFGQMVSFAESLETAEVILRRAKEEKAA